MISPDLMMANMAALPAALKRLGYTAEVHDGATEVWWQDGKSLVCIASIPHRASLQFQRDQDPETDFTESDMADMWRDLLGALGLLTTGVPEYDDADRTEPAAKNPTVEKEKV